MEKGEMKRAIGDRFGAVRFRTWSMTIVIMVVLVFYYMANVTTKQTISWIDCVLICTVQFLAHFIYFPDGEIYGQKDPAFVQNRNNYNVKADKINMEQLHGSLREFCDYEYEERKKRYVLTQCGYIGITKDILDELHKLDKKQIKNLDYYKTKEVVNGEEVEKVIRFSNSKRKMLYNLIYKPIPVQKNHPETIMSAVENDGSQSIKDGSIGYKKRYRWLTIGRIFLIGSVMAYIGYTARNGFGIAEIVSILMCFFSLFATAVTSYNSGEQCQKVYKSRFYLELGNFIDEFMAWNKRV